MIEFDATMVVPMEVTSSQFVYAETTLTGGAVFSESNAMLQSTTSEGVGLQEAPEVASDEWIVLLLSTASSDAVAAGIFSLGDDASLNPQSSDPEGDGQEIVITGKRYTNEDEYEGHGGSGGTGGSTGGGHGSGDGGGGSGATAVAQHEQDCGSEDGAAVQAAKHVTGQLPEGVAGPPNPMTTASGNDWTKVEFGAVIVRNPDGTYGALNDMIYSSDMPGFAVLPSSVGQPVQGLWHSHPTRDDAGQRAIDRYPSPGDWAGLAQIAGQAGAASDPSLWITAPDGVTREFKLSERSKFESLAQNPERMVNGEGLDDRERAQSCG